MTIETIKINLSSGEVAAGATFILPFPTGKVAGNYVTTGAKLTDNAGNVYDATVSLGAGGITVTNPTGRKLTQADVGYLQLTVDTVGLADSELNTPAYYNAAGTALVVDGVPVALNDAVHPVAKPFILMPTDDTALWITDKTAGLVVEVDNSVLFDGHPTIKITIPAGTSGVLKVGTSGANVRTPYGWDRSNFAIAHRYTGFTGYTWSETSFPPQMTFYLGDAGYSNFWTASCGTGADFPELIAREGEWFIRKNPTFGVGGGSPAVATTMRTKLQWTQVSQATDCYIHIGLVGVMPARQKATLVFTADDGYDDFYTFLAPLMRHYDIPVSMALSQALVGTTSYMAVSQIQDLHADQSRLFDFVNHSYNNDLYSSIGATEAYNRIVNMRDYMRSTLGINTDGPLHCPYVQSSWGNDLVDLLSAGGFLSARGASATVAMHGQDQLIATGNDKLRWTLFARKFLGSSVSLAQAKTAVDDAITAKEFFMIGSHEFGSSADTYKWTYSDAEQLIGYIASKVAAGELECKSWTRWYADLAGRLTDRR